MAGFCATAKKKQKASTPKDTFMAQALPPQSKLATLIEKVLPPVCKQIARGRTNLLDITSAFEDYGIGKRYVRKTYFNYPDTYWTVTKVHISKIVSEICVLCVMITTIPE